MTTFISVLVLGLLICAMGIANMMGNISSLHFYHRHRVSAEDIKPLGRRVGLGTLICGAALIIYGVMQFVYELWAIVPFIWIGAIILVFGLAAGVIIMLLAIIKYNKGLF